MNMNFGCNEYQMSFTEPQDFGVAFLKLNFKHCSVYSQTCLIQPWLIRLNGNPARNDQEPICPR